MDNTRSKDAEQAPLAIDPADGALIDALAEMYAERIADEIEAALPGDWPCHARVYFAVSAVLARRLHGVAVESAV